ncbi:glycosyltransferase family 4 protein [Acidobacteriota bacterium]
MIIHWLLSGYEKSWESENFQDGGYAYETLARIILSKFHDLSVSYLYRGNHNNKIIRLAQFLRYIIRNRTLNFSGNIVIRDLFSTVFAPFNKTNINIILVHHIHFPKNSNQGFYKWMEKRFFRNAHKADLIIVVSEYWKRILEERGCTNVKVVYNSFDLRRFHFNKSELLDLKERLDIADDLPLIYLGNARPEKGYVEAYEALKSIKAEFITTGRTKIDHPIRHVYLSYRDYLMLLNISTVAVMMSKFDEGWCRNAHETMLCGTPVIGSGRGGMEELLVKGGQIVCDDFSNLKASVLDLLNDGNKRTEMSKRGREFAQEFSLEYFEKSWLSLIREIKYIK